MKPDLFLQRFERHLRTQAEPKMTCPFCGVESDVAHESQQGCIDALRSEILRVRDILQHVRSFEVPGPPDVAESPDLPGEPAGLSEEGEIEPLF